MSLFGNTGATSAGGTSSGPFGSATPSSGASGLFGGAAATSSAGGMFGGAAPATTATPAAGGLFGGAAPAATSAGAGGLFGATSATQAPSATPAGGLFGGLKPLATPAAAAASAPGSSFLSAPPAASAPSAGGLFGGAAAATAAPAPGGLFGGVAARTAAPAAGSLFGGLNQSGTNNVAMNPSRPGTLFGNTQANTQQQHQQQQAPVGQPEAFHSAYFQSLLEKNKKRSQESDGNGGSSSVPGLQLGLGDLSRRVRELAESPAAAIGGRQDSGAHYLLAGSGVNPGSTMRDLRSLQMPGVPATAMHAQHHHQNSQQPDWDPDSHKYVEQLQQQATLKMISEGLNRAQRDFDSYLEANIDINWEEQRRKVYEHFGLAKAGGSPRSSTTGNFAGQASFGRSTRRGRRSVMDQNGTPTKGSFGLQKSVIGNVTAAGTASAQLFSDASDKPAQATGATTVVEDRYLREKEEKFAEKVQSLNEARLRDANFMVLREFESVEGAAVGPTASGDSPSQLSEAYKALIEITEEGSATNPPRPRSFRDEYLDENQNSARSSTTRRRILDGSRRALEKQFYDQLTTLVARNPREAALGGIPSTINHVRAYVRIRAARKDLVPDGVELQALGDDHPWALVYFLLRSGFIREAGSYVAEHRTAFQSLDRNFITYISAYVNGTDRRLSRQLQDRVATEYGQRMRIAPEGALDPYRMACYKVIGRCDLSRRNLDGVQQGVEDWMWLQFALARESNRAEDFAGEAFGLDDIRDTVREIGQRHFGKGADGAIGGGGFGTFFHLQILAGMFEPAVAYLYQHAYVSAVHFAIALDFYGLLRVSDFSASETDLLTHTTKEMPQINLGRMLGYYTRDFRAANAVAAADYLCLIHLDADLPAPLGRAQASLCHEALRELVLETREFAALLGDIRADGTRACGAIEARLPLIGLGGQHEQFLRAVTLQAAAVADDAGRTTDAVLLYHLSEDYDAVIATVGRALAEAIAVDLGQGVPRVAPVKPAATQQGKDEGAFSLTAVDDPATLAQNFVNLYNRDAAFYSRVRPTNRTTVGMLLRMADARAKVEAGLWAEAIDIISSLSVLPLTAAGSVSTIRAMSQNLSTLQPAVSRLVGPLLLWAISAIAQQRDALLDERQMHGGGFDSDARRALRDQLTVQAKDLMVFAGLIKLRLSKGVWDGLVSGAGELGVF